MASSPSRVVRQGTVDLLGEPPWRAPLVDRLGALDDPPKDKEVPERDDDSDDEAAPTEVDEATLDWWRGKLQDPVSEEDHPVQQREVTEIACGCLRREHWLRRRCLQLAATPAFDRTVLILILINSMLMAAQDPRANETKLTTFSELFFNTVFTLEMIVKMIASGVFTGGPLKKKPRIRRNSKARVVAPKLSYFGDPWNRFDFMTVMCGWLPIVICLAKGSGSCLGGESGGINLTFLRVVRIIKVLKTVQRIPGMRCLVLSLVKSAPLLVQVMEVLLFIFFCFGAIGVQLFSGKLRQQCLDKDTGIVGDRSRICSEEPSMGGNPCGVNEICRDRDFKGVPNLRSKSLNRYISFDNILLGFATVLSTVSLEGWSATMYALMDATGPIVVIYFVLLVLIGSFFVINLIVAVIYQAYVTVEANGGGQASSSGMISAAVVGNDAPLEGEGVFLVDLDEDDMHDAGGVGTTVTRMDKISWRPRPPGRRGHHRRVVVPDRTADIDAPTDIVKAAVFLRWWALRDICCWISSTQWFDRMITASIVASTAFLMAEHDGQRPFQTKVDCQANKAVTALFITEMVIKMLGTKYIFASDRHEGRLNLFDGLITVGSVVELVLEAANGSDGCGAQRRQNQGDSSFARAARFLRLFRMLRSLRLVRHWHSMSHILSAVVRSGPGLANFSCLLMLFSWVYALAGMQMYAGKFSNFEKGPTFIARPRTNFDSLACALLTVFIVVSGENWDSILNDAFKVNGYIGLIFIVSMYLIGNFIVLNIFLAILLSNFETSLDASNTTLYDELEASNEIAGLCRAFLRSCRANLNLKVTPREQKHRSIRMSSRRRRSKRKRFFSSSSSSAVRSFMNKPDNNTNTRRRCGEFSDDDDDDLPKREDLLRSFAAMGENPYDEKQVVPGRIVPEDEDPVRDKLVRLDSDSSDASSDSDSLVDDDDDRREKNAMSLSTLVAHMQDEIAVGTYRRGRREYHDCFTGAAAVDWMLENEIAGSAGDATRIGQRLVEKRFLTPVELNLLHLRRKLRARRRKKIASAFRMIVTQKTRQKIKALVGASDDVGKVRSDGDDASDASDDDDDDIFAGDDDDLDEGNRQRTDEELLRKSGKFRDNHQLYRFCARTAHRLQVIGDPETTRCRRRKVLKKDRETVRRRMVGSGGSSLFIFAPDNPVRLWCVRCVTRPAFDTAVVVLVVISSAMLAATNPRDSDDFPPPANKDFFKKLLSYGDIGLTCCFFVELTLKVIAETLIQYLQSGWNVLDFVIVAVSMASLFLRLTAGEDAANLSYLKALRAVRALRPLRMINRYPAMKTVVDALVEAVPDVVNVAFVVAGFFCVFAVAGGTLFRGLLTFCQVSLKSKSDCQKWDIDCDYSYVTDADVEFAERWAKYDLDREECKIYWKGRRSSDGGYPWSALPAKYLSENLVRNLNTTSPLLAEWRPLDSNFDNIGQALLALFEVATLEGWPEFMFAAMDVTDDRDARPRRNASAASALFFVVFVVIGSFFVMNIFVGVVVHKFQVAKERTDGASVFLTDQQRAFVDRVKVLLDTGRPRTLCLPQSRWRQKIFYVVASETFELCIIASIVLNMVAISINHYDQTPIFDDIDWILNLSFNALFFTELVLKHLGFGLKQYWKDPWNRFDAFIVFVAIFDTFMTSMAVSLPLLGKMNLSLFRILRLVRAVKLINVNQGLKTLLKSLVVSLPSLMNVGSLLVLLIFVYASIGYNVYHDIPHGDFLTRYCNFDTFGYSMLTLFRCLTGEDWNKIMLEIVDGNNKPSAYAFFSSFMILGSFMMLNLCVAVILEAFAEFMDADSDSERQRTDLRNQASAFKDAWLKEDPESTMFIPTHRIVALLYDLPPPMGLSLPGGEPGKRCSAISGISSSSADPTDDLKKYHQTTPSNSRLDADQRFIIEYVRSLRVKVNEEQQLFYLDVLMAVLNSGSKDVDLTSIADDDSSMELSVMLLRSMDPRLRRKMHRHSFRSDLPELDLTHTVNAAVTLQENFRSRRRHRLIASNNIDQRNLGRTSSILGGDALLRTSSCDPSRELPLVPPPPPPPPSPPPPPPA